MSIASGGATPTTVWNSDSSGNTYQLGRQDFYSASTLAWRLNCASTSACNIDSETPTANAHHLRLYNGQGTELDSEGTSGVTVNNTSTSGTGGFTVYLGGADSGVAGFSVSGYNGSNANETATVGSASGVGNLQIGNHLNQLATTDYGGTCATSSGTTCHVSLQHSYTAAICFCSDTATSGPILCSAYYASGDIQVIAASSATHTYGAMCIGNPN